MRYPIIFVTLASAITLIFIAAMAAYLGVLDAIFNFLVQRIL